jgi:hypothetical protein
MALTATVLLSYYLHLQDLAVLLLSLGLLAGERNRNLTVAAWLLYIAPAFVVMIGHDFIFLMSLPLILLLLGIMQRAGSGSTERTPTTASA